MNRSQLVLLLPAIALAQQNLVTRGAEIFATTCANGYCHGVKGASGGAPRLAGRGLEAPFIRQVVTNGHGEMPAFGNKLRGDELSAVVAYVGDLNGISPDGFGAGRGAGAGRGPARSARSLSGEATTGRALFFEATRGFGRCSTCHQVDGNGLAITDPITKAPDNAAAMRSLATPHVRTASADGDSFPVVIVKNSTSEVILYDLTSPPPVRRMFSGGAVKIADGSNWRHNSVIQSYTDAEIESMLVFLKAVVRLLP